MEQLVILLSRLNVTRLLTGSESERAEATSQMAGALTAAQLLDPYRFVYLVRELDLDPTTVSELLERVFTQEQPPIDL